VAQLPEPRPPASLKNAFFRLAFAGLLSAGENALPKTTWPANISPPPAACREMPRGRIAAAVLEQINGARTIIAELTPAIPRVRRYGPHLRDFGPTWR